MSQPLLTKPVKSALLSMAAPAAFGMLMTFLFQLVDSYFVGQLGTQPLAAMSFAYPVYILVVSLFMGIASGVSATVGKALGEDNQRKAQSLTTFSVLLFSGVTCLLGLAGYALMPSTFALLGANATTIELIGQYMGPLYLGMFLLVGGLIANSALMAKGIMVQTTLVMALGGITNVLFDYLLIFGKGPFPEFGLMGAALATLISWLVILVLMLALLHKHALLSLRSMFNIVAQAKEILTISTPAIAAQILNPVAIAVITSLVAQYGDSAIAAYGIATRIESLLLTGILALSVILTPFVAQNYGAQEKQRLDQVIAYSGRMTVYWAILVFAILVLSIDSIMALFTTDNDTIAHGRWYLIWVGVSFPAYGLVLITSAFLNGVQQAKVSLKLTLVKSLGLTIPLAFLGAQFGSEYIWLAISLANILGALYARRLLYQWLEHHQSTLSSHTPMLDYWHDVKSLFRLT
ncbi:MATE family efflux transporter [Vibrio tubiashii]|uniref:Multidrug resistance protein NorM n=1 Tax=Vibrio tubiashii TaxID=29498 RepID=A0AAE5GMY1_9VIBR|nr:MATE family efflux transporter [Vibrio tubiashii]NOI79792.1 MATE family efflux transporter [Vibrio tubiashii]